MPQRMTRAAIASSLVAIAVCTGQVTPSAAADLGARQSRIGAIFADSPLRAARVVPVAEPRPQGIFYTHALKVPGYYGRPTDFAYRNYYGTSPVEIYSRLPYACGFVASC